MESIHGIDVSWIHTHNKDSPRNHKAPPMVTTKGENTSPRKDSNLPEISTQSPAAESPSQSPINNGTSTHSPTNSNTSPHSPTNNGTSTPKTAAHRPGFTRGGSSDRMAPAAATKTGSPSPGTGRRNSWLSSISSKFSPGSQGAPAANGSPPTKVPATPEEVVLRPFHAIVPKNAVLPHGQKSDGAAPYTPAPVKTNQPNFLQSALRRLSSSGGQLPAHTKAGQHGLCERKILNVDQHRERCKISELEQSKLRRVAFCVDVEIAGGPRYNDDIGEDQKKEKAKKKKMVEKGEGEALKHPREVTEEKERDGVVHATGEILPKEPALAATEAAPETKPDDPDVLNEKSADKKKEKKKRTEEERKARKEKKRKLAEANGTIPVELVINDSESSLGDSTPPTTSPSTPRTQASPTIDPVRIYRRCCQLRETPILKKITEQLAALSNVANDRPGVVNKLDLSGYWLQLPDLITLGDYLAVVPVKELIMENCGLTDEGLRVILAGLLAAKFPEFPIRKKSKSVKGGLVQQGGVVERLVLKNNAKIGREGWRYICLFSYLCRPLKCLDLSMIPFPQRPGSPTEANLTRTASSGSQSDTSSIFGQALGGRLGGNELELLNLAETGLSTEQLSDLIDGVCKSGLRRLGLAGNNITAEGMGHVARYVQQGKCEGLDLGGNDLKDVLNILVDSLNEDQPLWALSLANCELTPDSLCKLFPALAKLKNFRFIDLSHNHDLFESNPSALSLLRRYLPKMPMLKRIHLTDVSMTPEQAIALAEILPESPGLAHVNIMENPQLSALANAKDEANQEEACALYASLMAAVRVSKTLVCIDIDVPSPKSSEVVKALAKQVVAYCLRNMERGAVAEFAEDAATSTEPQNEKEVAVPDVLMHLVGHEEGYSVNHDDDEPAPDDDYVIGGTGVVKALGICLRNRMSDSRRPSQDQLPSEEGRNSPRPINGGKAKDMSKNLLGSARKIRARLQPALIREAKTGDRNAYHKLLFLDSTLEGMIKRFEAEYPETRLSSVAVPDESNASLSEASIHSADLRNSPDLDPALVEAALSDDDEVAMQPTLSRHNSDVSLASRALSQEEGRMHRFGQQFRRDILDDQRIDPDDPALSEPHLRLLRGLVDELTGDELKKKVKEDGIEMVAKELNEEASVLREQLIKQDPEGWEKFRESQEAAKRNQEVAGLTREMSAIA